MYIYIDNINFRYTQSERAIKTREEGNNPEVPREIQQEHPTIYLPANKPGISCSGDSNKQWDAYAEPRTCTYPHIFQCNLIFWP